MSKITLTNLVNLQNETTAVNAININNATLVAALDNTISRDGTSPNQMQAPLDMNSNRILNLPTPTTAFDPMRMMDVGTPITVSPLPVGGTVNQVLAKNSSTNFDAGWQTASNTLPTGGTTNQVLSKNSATNYDVSWKTDVGTPVGGASGQVLTKNTSADYDFSWAAAGGSVPVVTPEQFGYTTYGSGDAGPAINAAIASVAGPIKVEFGQHTYNIVTPVLVNKFSVSLKGQGDSTILSFVPASNNQSMITWNISPTTTGIYYGRLMDFRMISADTSFVKTAVNLVDIGDMEVSGLVIGPAWHDTTNGSIALQTNGRQCTEFRRLELFADKPLVIKPNTNQPQLCADHFHFIDLYLAATGNPCITVDPAVVFSNTTFDGFQAWVSGTYGFYAPLTTSPGRSYNLTIKNIRTEGGTSATAYSIYIDAAHGGMFGLSFDNNTWDTARKGAYLRGCSASIRDTYFPAVSTTEALNMDSSNFSIRVDNCRWESASTQNIGTLLTKYSYNYAGNSIPSNALYSN
jgi:hypothetical protein